MHERGGLRGNELGQLPTESLEGIEVLRPESTRVARATTLRQQPALREESPAVAHRCVQLRAVPAPAAAIEPELVSRRPVEPSEPAAGAFPRGAVCLAAAEI